MIVSEYSRSKESKIKTYHGDFVLSRCSTGSVEVQALLNLLLEDFTKLGGWLFGEVIDSRGDGALVGEESRDTTLVLRASLANERGVVQKTVLRSVALSLQSSEESLLSTKNLDGRRRVLGEVGQATSVRDKTSTDNFSNQRRKVRCDDAHLGGKVSVQRLAVLRKADDSVGESNYVLHVGLGDFLTHTVLGGVNDALSDTLIILHESSDVVQVLIGQVLLVLHEQSELGVALVVRHDLDEFREVPRIPFTDTHRECVDSLVQLVEDSNSLNNVVVITLDGELDLSARIGVTKTKLGSVHVTLAKLLQQLGGMQSESTEHVLNNLAGVASLTFNERKCRLDTSSKSLVSKTHNNLLVLVRLRKIQLEERNKSLRGNTFRNIVDFTKGLLVVSILFVSGCKIP